MEGNCYLQFGYLLYVDVSLGKLPVKSVLGHSVPSDAMLVL